jgi:hypothetical protein
VSRPPDLDYAVHLSKIVSKLSPIIGNMLEYGVVSFLNEKNARSNGKWVRQDPGFPDTIFLGSVTPIPGIEKKLGSLWRQRLPRSSEPWGPRVCSTP